MTKFTLKPHAVIQHAKKEKHTAKGEGHSYCSGTVLTAYHLNLSATLGCQNNSMESTEYENERSFRIQQLVSSLVSAAIQMVTSLNIGLISSYPLSICPIGPLVSTETTCRV
jgi:hypothetical protein